MKIIKQPKLFGFTLLITIFLAVYGGILSIDGMREWYPSLVKPFNIPIWLFSAIQLIYYLICIAILYRLFSNLEQSRLKQASILLFIFMMFFAESWNYFFLGLKSVSLGFWLLLAFCLIAFINYINLRKVDKTSSIILAPYLVWLVFDIVWLYRIYQVN